MRPTQRIVDFIRGFEKLRLKAYMPTANDVPTIGYGHTDGVKMGDTCTKKQAEAWFTVDMAQIACPPVDELLQAKVKLTQGMYDALCSLCFNCGASPLFSKNTIGGALRRGDYVTARNGFSLWIRQDGQIVPGLVNRRKAEQLIFEEQGLTP